MKKFLSVCLALAMIFGAAAFAETTPAYTETVVSIDAGDHMIPATICMPNGEGPFPAVVMLHGTASSRNEAGNGYKMAAPVLAEKYGVATIRIDFMGNGESTADYKDYNFASAIGDAVKAAQTIGEQKNVDAARIGVMGWSQGGTIALLACARHPEIFKSIVTWAGAPDMRLDGFFSEANYEEAKKNGYFVMNFDWRSSLNVGLQWCEDVMNTDVLGEFAAFTGPVLAIAGSNDTTVDPTWSTKIAETSKNEKSSVYFIEGMDHTFNVFSEPDFASLNKAIELTGTFFADTL